MSEIFNSYAQILAFFQPSSDDVDALLDPAQGMSAKFRQIAQQQLDDAQDPQRDYDLPQSEIDALKLEADTWHLVQELYGQRLSAPYTGPTPSHLISLNPYIPTSTIAQTVMHMSRGLNELRVVRDWLQQSAPKPQVVEQRAGYWGFTRLQIVNAKRTGRTSNAKLVKEMDMDATNRGSNPGVLDPDDAAYEQVLTQALYAYIRAGMHEEAMSLCKSAGRPWRAASLRGGVLFSWSILASPSSLSHSQPGDTSMAIDSASDPDASMNPHEGDHSTWHGNLRRKIWQRTCTVASSNTYLSAAERALHAALAPSSQTLPALLPMCRTWEDHLWSRVIVLEEERMGGVVARLGTGSAGTGLGGFWETGFVAVDDEVEAAVVRAVVAGEDGDPAGEALIEDEDEWREEVGRTLATLFEIGVEDGPGSRDAFHQAQLMIILDRTSQLIESFAATLDSTSSDLPSSQLIRFFAHLVLFLRLLQQEPPLEASHRIVDAYVGVLEADGGQTELVALYASSLGDNAVSRYAHFLAGLDIRTSSGDRKSALLRAREYGLDVAAVAFETARVSSERAFKNLPVLGRSLPNIVTIQKDPLTDNEVTLIRSVEWLVVIAETYYDALRQSNAILRYFLCLGKVQASQMVLASLPPDLAAHSIDTQDPGQGAEHLQYRDFFVLWDSFGSVYDVAAEETRVMGQMALGLGVDKEAQVKWLKEYEAAIDKLQTHTIKLLQSDWLTTDVEEEEKENIKYSQIRRTELTRIRRIYVPEIIIRLHGILLQSKERFPLNVRAALELTNIVADSRYKLYYDFISDEENKLGTYLRAVRAAVLAGLEINARAGSSGATATTSDPFRIMVS